MDNLWLIFCVINNVDDMVPVLVWLCDRVADSVHLVCDLMKAMFVDSILGVYFYENIM